MDAVTFAYNSSPHKATDIEPLRSVFTRQIRDPAFLLVAPETAESMAPTDPEEFLEQRTRESKSLFDLTRKKLEKDVLARKKAYDRKSVPPSKFSVNQLVRRKVDIRVGKFAPRYEGPFRITRIFPNNPNVVEIDKGGNLDTVNVSKIRPWEEIPPDLICDKLVTPVDSLATMRVPKKIRRLSAITEEVEVDGEVEPSSTIWKT